MKKLLALTLIILVILIVACKPAIQTLQGEVMEKETMEKPDATGDAAVDAVGNDINSVDSVEKDLNTDELSDLDAGLSDVENI